MLIDVIRPAQWAAAQWAEPLDAISAPTRTPLMARYLPAYREANIVNGKVIALPSSPTRSSSTTARISEKYGSSRRRPGTSCRGRGAEDHGTARSNANLRGFETAGAPIEGTVCTFLVPLWGAGGSAHRRARQAQPRRATRRRSRSSSGRDLQAGERAAAEHRRDPDRPHPPGFPGRQPDLRDELGLRLEPLPERRRQPGEGQGRRRAAARLRGGKCGDLHRRLATRGDGLLARTRPRR